MDDQGLSSTSLVLKKFSRFISVAFGIIAIFLLVNLFTCRLLQSPQDGLNNSIHLAYIEWINQFFPSIPHWYPQGGGGVSLLHGQPILAYLLVIIVHRISNLSLINAYYLTGFLALFLTSLAIYIYGWFVSRKHIVGVLAAVLYLIAPISWVGFVDGRMFPQVIAMTFFAFSLMCFHCFLTHHLAQSQSSRRRLWLVGCLITLAGAILTDRIVGSASILAIILHAFTTSLLQDRIQRERSFLRAAWGTLMVGFILSLVIAFYIIPHTRYANVASIGVLDSSLTSTLSIPTLPNLFGFSTSGINVNIKNLHIPLLATILFIFGALLSLLGRREGREIYLMAFIALACVFITQLQLIVPETDFGLQTLFNPWTWLLILTVLIPMGSAWGVHTLTATIINFGSIKRKEQIGEQSIPSMTGHRGLLTSTLAFVIVGSLIAFVPISSGYGPMVGSGERKGLLQELASMEWPGFEISDLPLPNSEAERLTTYLPEENLLRIDVSPHLEDLGGELLAVSDASQIQIDPRELSLIQPGWEYQRNVFYSRDLGVDEFGNSESLNNAAQYFGTEYIFLDSHQDRVDLYKAAGWELVHDDGGVQLWYYPDSMELVSFSSKPAILITEKPGREIYMTIFRLANDGLLTYQEAYLVEGKERIDFYTLDDLKPFNAIFLVGYDYQNQRKAWETLAAYVEQGGSLFVDTGWQFAVAEWEFEQAPDVLPVRSLSWTNYGMVEEYELGSLDIAGEVDVGKFKPLTWEGGPWAVSGAEASDMQDWGRMVLSADGRPLIVAGEYGAGKVVWSGMNLIGHALYLGENQEELKLLHNIIIWLLDENEGVELDPPGIERDHPDGIVFNLTAIPTETTWLYWREAYYPNWHAYLYDDVGEREIPIYRGGPGFMLMPIETSSEDVSVTLRWETSFIESASIVVSILGVLLLIAIAIDGLFLNGQGLTWIKIAFTIRLPKPFLDEEAHQGAEKKLALEISSTPGVKQDIPLSGKTTMDPNTFEAQIDDEQEALLKSWLDDKDNEDDPWVNRILDPDHRK